ncbi:hypothetical protein [Microbispora sp. CA-102843]|uniref:hypothetical protein n=1 Tax=Microbispora sp. CA-102843 TaxID=3239952 RepID=UPI003D8E27A2
MPLAETPPTTSPRFADFPPAALEEDLVDRLAGCVRNHTVTMIGLVLPAVNAHSVGQTP